MRTQKQKDILAFITLLAFVFFLGNIIPTLIGFVGSGFDTQAVLNQYTIYQVALISGSIILIICFLIALLIKKDDSIYGNGIFFGRAGQKPSFEIFSKFTNLQLFLLFFTIFLALFTTSITTGRQEAFTFIPFIEQQFTETGSVLFTTFLVPFAENVAFSAFLALIVVGLRFYARKNKWSEITFRVYAFVGVSFGGATLEWAYHLLRYGSSEVAQTGVFFFWLFLGLITAVTGSFTPGLAMHMANNLVFDLKRFFANDSVVMLMYIVVLILAVTYIVIYRGRLLGRKS